MKEKTEKEILKKNEEGRKEYINKKQKEKEKGNEKKWGITFFFISRENR